MLYGLKPHDPLTLTLAVAALTLVAVVASFLPAHRAARLDPMAALREDGIQSSIHYPPIHLFSSFREPARPATLSQTEALAARERAVLASVAKVETKRLSPIFIDGDHSAIHWRFEFTPKDNGPVKAMEEIALQTWHGNELIAEHFFYDPRQMKG